jgi:Fic family protein
LPLSLRLIRELHKILLTGVRGREKAPGAFRRVQVAIGATRQFVPSPRDRLMPCLDALEKYLHVKHSSYDPLVDCFLVHYQFLTIHPFMDGNGRVGRLLLALMLHRCCGLSKPWLYLSEYCDKHRDEYMERLFKVSTESAWDEWIEFCLRGARTQAEETIVRCQRLLKIREDFMDRIENVGGCPRGCHFPERALGVKGLLVDFFA